jgi:hypothetical protein
MTTDIKEFLKQSISLRKKLISEGKSYRNQAAVEKIIKGIEQYLSFYPNLSRKQLVNYMKRHKSEILLILPGRGSGQYFVFRNAFRDIINPIPESINHHQQKLPF